MSTDTTSRLDIELRILEELLGDDCKCGSTHSQIGALPCSIQVVARKTTTCGWDFLICEASYVWNKHFMSIGGICDECLLPGRDCWTITPV